MNKVHNLACLVLVAAVSFLTYSCSGSPMDIIGLTRLANKIEYVQPNVIPETSLDLFLSVYDTNNQLVEINASVDIVLWNSQDSVKGDLLIQQWKNIGIGPADFEENLGYWLTLKYENFVPEPSEYGYIYITLICIDGTDLTYEGSILLLRGSCCA